MHPVRKINLSEHTAQHLREGFRTSRWSGKLPGVWQLARELKVSRDVVRAALRLLEAEGAVSNNGLGKSREVTGHGGTRRPLRVGILLTMPLDQDNSHSNQLIFVLRQALEAAGHATFVAPRTAVHFHGHVGPIKRYMEDCKADAWILYSAGRDVLEMASTLSVPVLALGGQSVGLPIAISRSDLTAPIEACVDELVGQGHRSVVLVCPPSWRVPQPSPSAQCFLDRLRHHGIRPSLHYNLPDWEHTPEGLNALLRGLFSVTPPTALLVMEPECLGPVLVFLAGQGLRVPDQVSLINILPDPMQAFYRPAIAHFEWPVEPHVKRVLQWVQALVQGKSDRRACTTHPVFVPAESIGPRRSR